MASLIPGVFQTQAAPARPPVFYTVATPSPFPLDYRQRNFIYFFSNNTYAVIARGYSDTLVFPANAWINVPFPEGTKMQVTADSITVQCVDVPLVASVIQVPRLISNMFEFDRQTVTTFSTGQLSGAAFSELAIDFTVYAINGGAAPTVTFQVARVGLDGQLYVLEKATALSAPGTISYSIGAGLDGKSFAGLFQVDMIVTGNPTSVNISGSIKAKQ